MDTIWVSFDGWLDKEEVVHIHDGILLSHKKRWNTAICDNMGGAWEYHAKRNKSDGKCQEPYDFTYMWNIKLKATNEQARNTSKKLIDTVGSMVVTRGKGIGGQ